MPYNTFPPKFSSDITYPAILNLDELDMIDSPVGDVSLGTYFSVSFGYGYNDVTPWLTYGKHGFKISMNPTVEAWGYPRLRAGTRILFELKDSNGIVLFSDVTPFHASDNLKFMGYTWIKEDPLRTYESVTEGTGTMTIVGIADVDDNHWSRIYNVRSTLYLDLDYKIEEVVDNIIYTSYYPNLSPIIFKNIKKMGSGVVSGSGLFISESRVSSAPELIDDVSLIHISASNLKTYSGTPTKVNIQYLLSGSNEDNWQSLASVDNLSGHSTIYEDDIHSDYAEGINPLSLAWTHALTTGQVPYDETGQNKVKFKLTFADIENNLALNNYPFSGEPGDEFSLQYPSGSDNWLYITGTMDYSKSGEGGFNTGFTKVDTMAGQFDLHTHGFGIRKDAGGQLFNAAGELIEWGGSGVSCEESEFGCGDPPLG